MGHEEFKEGLNEAGSMEPPDKEPWLPFRSREDFELAEIVHDAAMNQSQIDALIKFIHHCEENPGNLTFKGFQDLRKSWENSSALLTEVSIFSICDTGFLVPITQLSQFERHEIELEHDGVKHQFESWSRPLWGWIMDHLTNPDIVRQFEWDAQTVQRYDGKEFTRVYTEPWTGDRFSEVQVCSDDPPRGDANFLIVLIACRRENCLPRALCRQDSALLIWNRKRVSCYGTNC